MSAWASDLTVKQITEAQEYKETLKCGFVVSRKIGKTVIGREIRSMASEAGIPVLAAEIEQRVAFAESLTMGQTIFEWAEGSAASNEITRLTKEIEHHVKEDVLTAAPKPKQPTDDQIAAFERGGAGHDKLPRQKATVRLEEPSKRLSLDLPQSVHTRFKTACSATGRKMVNELQDFIERRTSELENEAGITHK